MRPSLMIEEEKDEALAILEKTPLGPDYQYLETVVDILDWVLGEGDDPLEDYRGG